MNKQKEKQVDVMGAGLVALLAVIGLTLDGVSVLVVERLAHGWQGAER